MKIVHSWLADYLGDALPDPAETTALLTAHAFEIDGVETVAGETVIDVDVLPNRSSDCLSHRGVARELASILDVTLAHDPLAEPVTLEPTSQLSVSIADPTLCPRFTAALITDVRVKESPKWLQDRLAAMGQRSINNIVDATNYVMYALGQPLHAYDADRFPQTGTEWRFLVRPAEAEETVTLLGEQGVHEPRVITCRGGELLIIDQTSGIPIGLAGVKGGTFAGVTEETKRIIIEAAHFDPQRTRQTARQFGIVIDASKRFENEPSPELPPYAQREIVNLISRIADGTFVGWLDSYPAPRSVSPVTITRDRCNALLGLELSQTTIADLMRRIGASIQTEDPGTAALTVLPPWERSDLVREEDLIEEVGRLHGYTHIPAVLPPAEPLTGVNRQQYYAEKVRHALLAVGFSEVITSSFQKKGAIQLQNALASDKSYLRSGLTKNLRSVLEQNIVHKDLLGVPDIRVFEIGTVFQPAAEGVGVTEQVVLGLGVRSKGSGYTPKDDPILALGQTAVAEALGVTPAWEVTQGVAQCNFSLLLAELPAPAAYEPVPVRETVAFRPISPYPAVARDIALWVPDGVSAAQVEQALVTAAGELCVRSRLFDTFTKDGRTSYAFRLVFQAMHRTLTDVEVNQLMERLYEMAALNRWEVR